VSEPEAEFEDWTGATGDRWLANIDSFEGMLSLLHRRLADSLEVKASDSILDIGCGCGPLSLMLADKLGGGGSVTGLDIAPQLTALASKRAANAGLSNTSFVTGDAGATIPAGAPFDRLVSAFGVMFFDDTQAAFTHLHSLAKPGAKLDFYAWAPPESNPWMGIVMGAMSKHVEMPEGDPDGPGPFRLADADATSAMLAGAGFSDVSVTEIAQLQPLGGPGASVEEAAEFVMAALDMGKLLESQGADKAAALADLKKALAPHATADGVMLPGAALHYSAKA
jgi:SAM-dependent methyltransferase